jgi:gliding motility-associated-like protein
VASLTVNFTVTKVCWGNETTLINHSVAIDDSIQYIMWDLNGDGRFDEMFGQDTVNYLFTYPGPHEVGLKIITYGGETKALYKLALVAEVRADFIFETGCMYQPIQFTDQSVATDDVIINYTWDFGDGSSTSSEQNPVHQFTSSGSFSVKQTITTLNGCKDSTTSTVSIGNQVIVNLQFMGDTVFVKGDSVIAYLPNSYDSVLWSTGSKSNAIVIKTTGYYWVRAFVGQCYADKSFNILVEEYGSTPVIMNLITPNGDGMNDYWKILNLYKVGPCEVKVYNRYGENVFSATSYNNEWDGHYKGNLLPNDTYYYNVQCLNKDLLQGTVNILK